jgi:LPXTG-site transpeptidase (sortase) family protein
MQTAQTFEELYHQLKVRLVPFVLVFFAVVFVTYFVLYVLDFYPEPVSEEVATDTVAAEVVEESTILVSEDTAPIADIEPVPEASESVAVNVVAAAEPTPPAPVTAAVPSSVAALPTSITIDALDRTIPVLNPASPSYAALDEALLSGVVRHPQSADLQNTGNMLILGHSSYLPNVLNRNFQAFNGLENLSWGDTVRVTSEDTEYIYRVDRVYFAPASDVYIRVGDDPTPKLTLVTCKVLGAQEDRYILEASLVNTVAL